MNKIEFGNCLEIMQRWIDEGVKVNTCVTSPPYYGLRDYGTATWIGGDKDCNHINYEKLNERNRQKKSMIKVGEKIDGSTRTRNHDSEIGSQWQFLNNCKKCGAIRQDQQLGLEETPQQYINSMVRVFRLVRELLTDDGTLWVNIGDSYAGNCSRASNNGRAGFGNKRELVTNRISEGLKNKDLIGIPWMLAFALREDGWYLRQDIIWHKPNPMPESVRDRCTKAHEYIFLLSKSPKYYFDYESIMENSTDSYQGKRGKLKHRNKTESAMTDRVFNFEYDEAAKRRKRDVWSVTVKPYKGAHFATYPVDLIEPCIKAGCPDGGIVLDPFMGSGTTAQVAIANNKQYLGCELNTEYKYLQDQRIGMI